MDSLPGFLVAGMASGLAWYLCPSWELGQSDKDVGFGIWGTKKMGVVRRWAHIWTFGV